MSERVLLGPVATWFPDTTAEVATLAELDALPANRREHALALGIDTVRTADTMAEVDLAAEAALRALDEAGLAATDLDALVLVTGRAPQYLLASEATRLQHRLGASRAFTTAAGDLGCVSVSAAMTLAASLLRGDPHCRTVLLVTAAKTPTRTRYRAPMTLLGDGAAAVLMTTSGPGRWEFVDQIVRSEGKYADLFRIDYRDVGSQDWIEACADEATYSFRLAVESKKRFDAIIPELLRRNGIRDDQVGPMLMQNLSAGAFAFWEEALDRPVDKACRSNLAAYGHLGSMDMLLNLESVAATRASGEYALLLNSSPVAAWSAGLLRRI
ncbi:3-oxoacyl-ACP synthase [Nocardia huaxiensis]|uniref:3-oxoacyl-ACP synthase n=1 Tax=Nocardia huaxiensis TaxID=2755382 RepID=A0A7D6V5V0_9NOCA|nr:3-oxoacyl-ACP synthase [Nocardia huaxiensis]QLY28172.1 3-oxoacyl-ACP synthase [Nocardia huaxiensis]UFS98382.1 3-oxoacyl-ACP synthase [Nocardia huaxiensis]